jgi:hypothetical protein
MYFFKSMGMFLFPMLIMAVVILVLAIRKFADLFGGKDLTSYQRQKGLHAILFWGVVSAVFGVLGQVTGIYNALNAIRQAKEISPQVVAMGLAQSYTTTIFGLELMIIAGIIWFILLGRSKKLGAAA